MQQNRDQRDQREQLNGVDDHLPVEGQHYDGQREQRYPHGRFFIRRYVEQKNAQHAHIGVVRVQEACRQHQQQQHRHRRDHIEPPQAFLKELQKRQCQQPQQQREKHVLVFQLHDLPRSGEAEGLVKGDLRKKGEGQQPQQIFFDIVGVAGPHRDHIGEDREGEPPDDPHQIIDVVRNVADVP